MGNTIIGCALLLGILIFLPEPGDGLADFGAACRSGTECQTSYCHKRKCGCPDITSGEHNVLVQFFDKAKQKCVSAVGKACTLRRDPNDPLPPLECVEHAICRMISHNHRHHFRVSTDLFGHCKCRDEYKETKDHHCALPHQIGRTEEQVDKSSERYIKTNHTTWSPVSKGASTNTESHSLICFAIPIYMLLINYFSVR